MINKLDLEFLKIAFKEVKAGFQECGCPIGSVLTVGGDMLAKGRNQRV